MFNTLSTPFSLMDSVDIIHLKIGRAPLPTVYGWNGTEATTGGCMGPPSNFYLNLQYIVHTVPLGSLNISYFGNDK